ncbi:MAG: diacylglycerol kinase family protein [Actinobacteria bacterium]|nr:diacylglycerol kinase family protein [Actinomycetota bacterium]
MSTVARRVVVAINPNSAFGKNRGVGEQAVAALRAAGHDVVELRRETYDELREAARTEIDRASASKNGQPVLVVVGGDGMVSLGVNLLAESSVGLGVVPAGTGNDLARAIGLPVGDIGASIRQLVSALEKEPTAIDLARITHGGGVTWYAAVLSGGFDAIVNERANRMRRPRGKSRYTIALLLELVKLRPRHYNLTLDGEKFEVDANLVAVANGESLGGGMRICPDASLHDGLLDVAWLAPVSRRRFLQLFPKVFRGEHVDEPEVTIRRSKHVHLDSPDIVAYADGERVGPLPVDIVSVPAAVRVYF